MEKEQEQPHELTTKEQKFLDSYGIAADAKIPFHIRAPKTLFWLMFLSSGFYGLYWFYKNWEAVTTVTEHKISPFWRTIFTIFYAWPLFKIMVLQAKVRGFDKNYSGGWLAIGYIFVPAIVSSLYHPEKYDAGTILFEFVSVAVSVWFLIRVEEAATFAVQHDSLGGTGNVYGEVTWFEKKFVAAGLIFVLGLYLLLIFSQP